MTNSTPSAQVPVYWNVLSTCLSLVTFGILSICLTRRIQALKSWKDVPFASWLIIVIYIDSTLFVFATAIISRGLGVNKSRQICDGAILLCLICYMTTKVLIYYFLVEKAYIIRGSRLPRFKTKLWLFNFFGMLVPYTIVIVLNFVYRIAYINKRGICIIGMEKLSMFPLIIFDVLVNIYLTTLFLVPLRRLHTYRTHTRTPLHRMALRTFLGSLFTLLSSVANLTVLMLLRGEPAWICLMCCNADILFSVLVLHWVTSIDGVSRRKVDAGRDGGRDVGLQAGGLSGVRGTRNIGTGTGSMSAGQVSSVERGGSRVWSEVDAGGECEAGIWSCGDVDDGVCGWRG